MVLPAPARVESEYAAPGARRGGPADDHAVYQPISYSAESFIDVDKRYPGALDYLAPLKTTCSWLVQNQSADGSWGDFDDASELGFTASGDAQRSPRAREASDLHRRLLPLSFIFNDLRSLHRHTNSARICSR